MDDYPKLSGGLDAYEFYVEIHLQWLCDDCGECVLGTQDILEDEQEAPYAKWATRKGKEGMKAGWYVRPLSEDGSLRRGCLCPKCVEKRGLIVCEN
jgi:hypothetical protein